MKNVLDSMEYVEDKFINEAEKYSIKKKKYSWIKYISVAACFIFIVYGIAIGKRLNTNNSSGISLQAKAAEIGKEYMQFGATMPQIINVNDKKVIMYDYVGIWVYDIGKRKLVGFCDFRPINMTQIQGDPCVFVEATSDGKYVKFYMSDGSRKYLYDVEKNTYKKVDQYDYNIKSISSMNISETKRLSDYSETYVLEDGTYISYTLDIKDDSSESRYGDLIIITEKDGINNSYRPFFDKTADDVKSKKGKHQTINSEVTPSSTGQDSTPVEQVNLKVIDYAEICRGYISENQNKEIKNIVNWDTPTIKSVDNLPNKYYIIQEKENIEKITSVTFNTTSDEILGPICFYVDSDGTILGSNYRK